jgi:hypothetical protein
MAKLEELKKKLRPGKVYRREDLSKWSTSVDRHLQELVLDGKLEKLSQGLYYSPKQSSFGKTPPEEQELLECFLKTDRFLVTSPNLYNSLGLGTTQLYNKRVVYNNKRHGLVKLGNREYQFHFKLDFPNTLTKEFLMVDLVNNLETLAEDSKLVLAKVADKVPTLDQRKLGQALKRYGHIATKKIFASLLHHSL